MSSSSQNAKTDAAHVRAKSQTGRPATFSAKTSFLPNDCLVGAGLATYCLGRLGGPLFAHRPSPSPAATAIPSAYLINPSVRLSIRPSVRPSIHPSARPCVRPSIHPSIRPSIRPFVPSRPVPSRSVPSRPPLPAHLLCAEDASRESTPVEACIVSLTPQFPSTNRSTSLCVGRQVAGWLREPAVLQAP